VAHRIEIGLLDSIRDAAGEKLVRRIQSELGIEVGQARCIDVYTIAADMNPGELTQIANSVLRDPVIQQATIDQPLPGSFDWAIEVGLRPGVTDNVGRTAREVIALALERPFSDDEGVYTSHQYRLSGHLTQKQIEYIAEKLLANSLIQHWRALDAAHFVDERGFEPFVPCVLGTGRRPVEALSLDVADLELELLSRARVLALNLNELHAIRDYFRRPEVRAARKPMNLPLDPTDVELEALAQTWSEHCKHKIFNARIRYHEDDRPAEEIDSLFDTYIRGLTERVRTAKGSADQCLSVFSDNAGVIRFNQDWSLVFKVETHNSPSALDPYGGALTGIVGVNRDPLGTGMGARLIFNTDVFCLADPNHSTPLPRGLLHPRRILEGVREGVEHGGNKSGIPTVNGSLSFDERFLGKPLVFCGTAGLLPALVNGKPGHQKEVRPGDRIIMVGGRIGKDGIHGATFSSEELHEGSPVSAVQIGDPITQKRMSDFLLCARDQGLYRALTDDGAGGLSSSVGEMAQGSGGCELDLTHAPLKYAGLSAWEILLSEAQERMTVAVPTDRLTAFMALAQRYHVEATDLGSFTDSGLFQVWDQGQVVASLQMEFLHHGLPQLVLNARFSSPPEKELPPAAPSDIAGAVRGMLARLNICSKAYWVRQYDHEVQAGTVIKPLVGARDDGPSDAAVFRPLLESFEAIAVSHGICPRYSDRDTYDMAACAVDEAVRNALCVGADPERLAGLDNFCWCDPIQSPSNPDGEFKLGQLVRAARGLYDTCVAYGIPCISGKDSMKNDAVIDGQRISIPPTLLFSLLGTLDDARQAVSMDVKAASHVVYVLGLTRPELGASEYYQYRGARGGRVPKVRVKETWPLYQALHRAMRDGCVASCHDCSDGGLAVALAESAFAGDLGVSVDLRLLPTLDIDRDDLCLFSESPGRFVVTVKPEHTKTFEQHLRGCTAARVGVVTAERQFTVIGFKGSQILAASLETLRQAWLRPLDY
jgi:phosphoribosylformylglycinamidine synthase II